MSRTKRNVTLTFSSSDFRYQMTKGFLNFKKICYCVWPEKTKKMEKFCSLLRALSIFGMNLLNIRDRIALFTCIVGQDFSDSRLPWLERVLLCLDGVELTWVSLGSWTKGGTRNPDDKKIGENYPSTKMCPSLGEWSILFWTRKKIAQKMLKVAQIWSISPINSVNTNANIF